MLAILQNYMQHAQCKWYLLCIGSMRYGNSLFFVTGWVTASNKIIWKTKFTKFTVTVLSIGKERFCNHQRPIWLKSAKYRCIRRVHNIQSYRYLCQWPSLTTGSQSIGDLQGRLDTSRQLIHEIGYFDMTELQSNIRLAVSITRHLCLHDILYWPHLTWISTLRRSCSQYRLGSKLAPFNMD